MSYSHSQLRIPLTKSKKRIWLLIEVVNGSTPFLLSIHAMKCLGAQIDLRRNQVYLSVLEKSLNIQENNNGLFMVRVKELCQSQASEATFTENVFHSQLVSESLGKDQSTADCSELSHAQPSRCDSDIKAISEQVMESLKALLFLHCW